MPHPITDALAGMTPEERAAYKAAQFAARPTPDNLMAGSRIVSITEGPEIIDGLLQFSVALWIDSGVGFELIDVSSVNPIRVVNPPILVPDPNGDIERTFEDPVTHVVTSTFYREDLDQALMQIAFEVTDKFEGTGGLM